MTTILNWRSGAVRACLSTGGGVAAIALIVAGCGGASGGQHASAHGAQGSTKAASSADVSRATPSADSSGVASIELADSKLGKILVDGTGDTLYLFQADRGAMSTCTGACATAWPPLLTNGRPIAGPGLSASKLGTVKRSDGATEVTYNGHPLYTFAGDGSPGQTAGEGSLGFGAEWDVLSAAGNKIGTRN